MLWSEGSTLKIEGVTSTELLGRDGPASVYRGIDSASGASVLIKQWSITGVDVDVDDNDSVRSFDEALIGEPVPHQAPHAGPNLIHAPFDNLRLGEVGGVSDLAVGTGSDVTVIIIERSAAAVLRAHGRTLRSPPPTVET